MAKVSSKTELGLNDLLKGMFITPMTVTATQTIKATLGTPHTILYPLERPEVPPTYRGQNAVIWDLCIGCGICHEVCPNKCLKMKPVRLEADQVEQWHGSQNAKRKHTPERPAINFGHCLFCGFCEDYCPTGAMTMTDFYELADYSRSALIYPARALKVEQEPVTVAELPLTNYMLESPTLDAPACIGCSKCASVCPTQCITMENSNFTRKIREKEKPIRHPYFDYSICIGCASCVKVCPVDCLAMEAI